MSKKFLSLLLVLCLLCSCTKTAEAPVEIPQEPAAPEEIEEVPVEEESRIMGDYVLLENSCKSALYPMLELKGKLLCYDNFSKQLECYSTNDGECSWRKPVTEPVLAVEVCDYWVGYDYRLRCEDCVIYQSQSDSSKEQRIDLPMSEYFAEPFDQSPSYDVYGSRLVYCDKNGDVYLGWTNGSAELLLSADELDPLAYENISPSWSENDYPGPHQYYAPQFLNDGERIMLRFRTGDDVLSGFVICDLNAKIIGGRSYPMQYGIETVNDSKVAIHTGAFGYCLTDAETGETTDCFHWDEGQRFLTWDYETFLEITSDPSVPFGPLSNAELTLNGQSLLKTEGSIQVNPIQMTEHFVLVILYPEQGEQQLALLRYREKQNKEPSSNVSWTELDSAAKNEGYKIIQRRFKPYNGKTLTLTMEVPQDWQLTEGRSDIDDAQGKKACVSLGIIRELQEGEGITNLENPEEMPFALDSSIVSFQNKLCLQTIGLAEDSAQYNSEIRSYNFVEEDCLVNVHFYVTKDDPESDEAVYRIMKSVKADITPKMPEVEPTWNDVSFSVSLQNDQEGLIAGKAVELSMTVPSNWILDTGNGVIADGDFFYADGTKAAEGFVIDLLADGETIKDRYERSLLSFDNPAAGAPNSVSVGGQTVWVKVNKLSVAKDEPTPAQGEESYSYTYFLPYKEIGCLGLTIYEQGDDFTGSIEKHRKILESIVFGEERDWL